MYKKISSLSHHVSISHKKVIIYPNTHLELMFVSLLYSTISIIYNIYTSSIILPRYPNTIILALFLGITRGQLLIIGINKIVIHCHRNHQQCHHFIFQFFVVTFNFIKTIDLVKL